MIGSMRHPWFPDAEIDGSYGCDEAALRAVAPIDPPDGFAERWRAWNLAARRTPADPELEPIGRIGAHDVSALAFGTADGLRIHGWLAVPSSGPARVGIVHSHGYGGREAPEFGRVPEDAAAVFPVARGLGAVNVGIGAPAERDAHVVHGIETDETYVLGRCASDLWSAANVLDEVVGPLPHYLVGESFGGGIGALALPWDDRLMGATLIVPSFGQHAVRLGLRCEGSGEALRRWVADHPEAREVLRTFDASTAALFARVPVRVEAALWDTVVPPPGQFAVAAGIAASGADLELAVLPAGHAEYPGLPEVRAAAEAATLRHIAAALAHRRPDRDDAADEGLRRRGIRP
ncbi:acetylxylan esterase [Agromyces sp. SYSU T00194]|uniref:acetylxylan esterase n=1 Tax=Agromyces chitinivorans TaxID=3158560 RepID=UPI003395D1A4